jgi:hypothetical protein
MRVGLESVNDDLLDKHDSQELLDFRKAAASLRYALCTQVKGVA